MIKIAHQCRAGLAARHVARGTAHIDVDDFGSSRFGNPGAFGHPPDLAACKLDDHAGLCRWLRIATATFGRTVDEIIAGGHLGNDEARPQVPRSDVETGRPVTPDIGGQESPVSDPNIAYCQWLKA